MAPSLGGNSWQISRLAAPTPTSPHPQSLLFWPRFRPGPSQPSGDLRAGGGLAERPRQALQLQIRCHLTLERASGGFQRHRLPQTGQEQGRREERGPDGVQRVPVVWATAEPSCDPQGLTACSCKCSP